MKKNVIIFFKIDIALLLCGCRPHYRHFYQKLYKLTFKQLPVLPMRNFFYPSFILFIPPFIFFLFQLQ